MPVEILTGTPSTASQSAAARALHEEICKSKNAWFRALASKRVGSIGNWGVVLAHMASVLRGFSNAMGAANMHQAPQPGASETTQGGGVEWPPKV